MKFQPPKGMRDFLPEDAIKFNRLIKIVKSTFEKYGFEPLFSPALESFELLSAKGGLGEAVKDEIYCFKDKSKRELGLRFDLTMPLARIVSSNPQLPKPFKRYQIERVWRYDNPQALRYREFWQADIDTVGSSGLDADAEVIAAICEVLEKLGFDDFKIRISDRRLIQEFLKKTLSIENWVDITKSLDKKDKVGEEKVKDELKLKGLDDRQIKQIFDFLMGDITFVGSEKFKDTLDVDLENLIKRIGEYGFGKYVEKDLFLVRGLEYYTSFVFEVTLGAKVSCGGGGRYDNLIKLVGGQDLPATGISLGLDRIFEVMKEREMKIFDLPKTRVKVFVASVNENVKGDVVKIAQKLREENVSCQTDLMNRNLTKQLEYADNLGIPYVLIVGEREVRSKKFKLKDMKKKTEKNLKLDEIIVAVNRSYR
jgi:histidyl-tRNA synthetase